MRLRILALAALLAGCATTDGVPIVVGKNAEGKDLYGINGHPKMDDVSAKKAALYCHRRAMVTFIEETGYQGAPFTFRCVPSAEALSR
jgi:hypothetical protein